MSKRILIILLILVLIIGMFVFALSFGRHYGKKLCGTSGYTCIKVKRGDSWRKLWPDPQVRRIVMRVNRRNLRLYPGITIAVPDNLFYINHLDVAPLPYFFSTNGRKVVVVDLEKQAFGAYDASGNLVHWGPVSGGKGYCPDVRRRCNTPRGTFYVFGKGTAYCISKKFPIPEGGAPMPYCMYFYNGYAMHASDLPGYHASHGCIRMFYEDAQWLNRYFVKTGGRGTKVIVR